MTQFASDSFDGVSGTELSVYNSAWSERTQSSGDSFISVTGGLRIANTTASIYGHSSAPPSADYEVSADIVFLSWVTGCNAGVIGRSQDGVNTHYFARYLNTVEGWQLYKVVNNTATQLGSTVSDPFAAGTRRLRLRMEGTTISVFLDADTTPIISVTDSSITAAGLAGTRLGGGSPGSINLDNWSADTLDAGGTVYTLAIDAGSYSITGQSILAPVTLSLDLDTGSYNITGQDVSLLQEGSYRLNLEAGTYNIVSEEPNVGISMILEAGTYTITGNTVRLVSSQDPVVISKSQPTVSIAIRIGL